MKAKIEKLERVTNAGAGAPVQCLFIRADGQEVKSKFNKCKKDCTECKVLKMQIVCNSEQDAENLIKLTEGA